MMNIKSTVMLLAMLLATFGDTRSSFASQIEFPTAGVTFRLPDTLEPEYAGGPNILAVLAEPDVQEDRLEFKIILEISPVKEQSLADFCEGLRVKVGGENSEATLSNQAAIEISASPNPSRTSITRARITERDGYFYLVLLRSRTGEAGLAEYYKVCETMKWIDRESPSSHLDLDSPKQLLSGQIHIALPKIAREYPSPNPAAQAVYAIYNYKDQREEFFFQVQAIPSTGERELSDVSVDFTNSIADQFKLAEKPKWRPTSHPFPMLISTPFPIQVKGPNGSAREQLIRYALARLPSNHLLIVQFGLSGVSRDEAAKYQRCIDAICETLKPHTQDNGG